MTTEADFLSAIQAAPDDATTKLVFADWLEERDDLRAGLLRRIVRFQELTTDAAECYERGGILPLLDGRFADWLAPLSEWGDVFIAERGLLRLAVGSDPGRGVAWPLDPAWGWVTELTADNRRGELPTALALTEQLCRTNLGICLLVNADAYYFLRDGEDLAWVTGLEMLGTPTFGENFEQLLWRGGMPRLREVRCERLGRETLERLAQATPDVPLRTLEFGITREYPRPEFEWLASSGACAGLEEFTFHGDEPLNANDLATLARAPWFPQLRKLDLPLAHINVSGMSPLAATGPLTRLEVLRVDGVSLDATVTRALVDGPTRRSLRTLDLASPHLDADAVHFLVECPHLANLSELSLWLEVEADETLGLLASAPWPRLGALVLGLDGASRQGMLEFLDGDLLPRLSYLGLRNNGRLQLHLEDLVNSPAVAGLLGLDLRGAPLNNREVAVLLGSRTLSRRCTLRIWVPNLLTGDEDAVALRKRFFHLDLNRG
jgi:uncharacterized protein (TIGR02996 family)